MSHTVYLKQRLERTTPMPDPLPAAQPGEGAVSGKDATARAPDIFAYLDYLVYLADWFAWMKLRYPQYSYRRFAWRANRTSPSMPGKVLAGQRNLTPASTQSFLKALALEPAEAMFFEDLVALNQAETPKLRAAAWEQVRATVRFRSARVIEGDSVKYLLHWYIPAIREFAACARFRAEPAWLASQLRPRITAAQAAEALDVLFALGFLERGPDGKVVQAGGALVTPHEFASMAAVHYHQGMLERAVAALSDTPKAERHFLGVTAAIPAALVPVLKRDLDHIQERLLERYDGLAADREVVYQINLNIFPLTEPIECNEP